MPMVPTSWAFTIMVQGYTIRASSNSPEPTFHKGKSRDSMLPADQVPDDVREKANEMVKVCEENAAMAMVPDRVLQFLHQMESTPHLFCDGEEGWGPDDILKVASDIRKRYGLWPTRKKAMKMRNTGLCNGCGARTWIPE